MTIEVTKNDILSMLYQRGYTIDIEERNGSKYVTLNGKHSLEPYKDCACYSTEFTDSEIRLDCVDKLLRWSGLRVRVVLDY